MSAETLRKGNLSMRLSVNWSPWDGELRLSRDGHSPSALIPHLLCAIHSDQFEQPPKEGRGQLQGSLQGERGSRIQVSAPQGFPWSRTSLLLDLLFLSVEGSFSDKLFLGLLREHSPGAGVGWYIVQSDYWRMYAQLYIWRMQHIHHKLSGLKQHGFIILEFWKSEEQSRSHWAQIQVSVGLSSFIEVMGNTIPWLVQPPTLIPLLIAPSIFKASNHWPSRSDIISLGHWLLCLSLSYSRIFVFTWIIWDMLPILRLDADQP